MFVVSLSNVPLSPFLLSSDGPDSRVPDQFHLVSQARAARSGINRPCSLCMVAWRSIFTIITSPTYLTHSLYTLYPSGLSMPCRVLVFVIILSLVYFIFGKFSVLFSSIEPGAVDSETLEIMN